MPYNIHDVWDAFAGQKVRLNGDDAVVGGGQSIESQYSVFQTAVDDDVVVLAAQGSDNSFHHLFADALVSVKYVVLRRLQDL